ncbi:response regulator transcription factor [Butyrivibrio sp. MC2013]|uniref:response regulator transcription factor n=1 Tax=Butyrivibrio sp. MC2013 TaxID=1280686 RepID=UPI00040911F4|nr:response regulator [Butyrivibrio sp. MC2013]
MTRIIVVDDERNIREGIVRLIDWDALGCEVVLSASGAAQVLSYLEKNSADIVITDIKMPVMDGLELSRRLGESYPSLKVIILTAYQDFELARTAIRYGVNDFIIKNDFLEELPAAVSKTIEEIEEERGQGQEVLIGSVSQRQEEYLRRLTEGGGRDSGVENELALAGKNFVLCAFEMDKTDPDDGKHNLREVLEHILDISLKGCDHCLIKMGEAHGLIVIWYAPGTGIGLSTVLNYVSSITTMVEEFMRLDLRMGLSREHDLSSDMRQAKEEAYKALAGIRVAGSDVAVYTDPDIMNSSSIPIDADREMAMISDAVFDEGSDLAAGLLKEFYDKLSESGCTFEQCQLYMLVICSSVIHKAVRYQIDVSQDFNRLENEIYEKIQGSRTIFSLVAIGTDTLSSIRRICIGKKNYRNELVEKVNDYIRKNYKDDVTLGSISAALYLNPSYLSRAYKKLTGKTITERITMQRIDKAKSLLLSTNMKIYEVARETGYNDPAYFTNVFLKQTGKSPTDFRMYPGKEF